MKTIRKFRSPIATMFFSLFLLLISCEKEDALNPINDHESRYTYDSNIYEEASILVENLYAKNIRASIEEQNEAIMSEILVELDLELTFPNWYYSVNNYSIDEKKEIISAHGIFSEQSLELIDILIEDLTVTNFDEALSNFIADVERISLEESETSAMNIFIGSLELINDLDPDLFLHTSGKTEYATDIDCIVSVVCFVCAFASLCTLTAATGGAAAIAVVGYVGSSIAFVRAC